MKLKGLHFQCNHDRMLTCMLVCMCVCADQAVYLLSLRFYKSNALKSRMATSPHITYLFDHPTNGVQIKLLITTPSN